MTVTAAIIVTMAMTNRATAMMKAILIFIKPNKEEQLCFAFIAEDSLMKPRQTFAAAAESVFIKKIRAALI
jgi:hypothetical protein